MTPDESFIRARLTSRQAYVNGDQARAYVREVLSELDEQRRLNVALAERVAKQSELLSKRAEKQE